MRDGEGTVQIACGKLRREGARQHAGRRGNRGNSLGRALLGGKRGNSLGRSSVGGTETARLLHTESCTHRRVHTQEVLYKQKTLRRTELLYT